MSLDLENALAELAYSVHDDALAERMNGRVYRMVAQVRRRRAARQTATGVASIGAAAAVVVGGMQLAGQGDGSSPIGTQEPTEPTTSGAPAPRPADWPVCGDPAPAATTAADLQLLPLDGTPERLSVAYGNPVPVPFVLANLKSMSVSAYSPAQIAVVQDGVVVGTTEADPVALGLAPGADATQPEVVITSCGGDTPLGDGDYTVVAGLGLLLADGRTATVVSPPVAFAITGESDGVLGTDAEREAALADLLASAARSTTDFPVCGSAVPPDEPTPITPTLTLEEREYMPGEAFSVPVAVQAGPDLPGTAQGTANHPVIVLARDGVVVASPLATQEAIPIDLDADGTAVIPAAAELALCSLPGSDAGNGILPAGTYQAYAVFTLAISAPSADGRSEVPWEPVVARSGPVDLVLR